MKTDKLSRIVACVFLSFVPIFTTYYKTSSARKVLIEQGLATEAIQTKTIARVVNREHNGEEKEDLRRVSTATDVEVEKLKDLTRDLQKQVEELQNQLKLQQSQGTQVKEAVETSSKSQSESTTPPATATITTDAADISVTITNPISQTAHHQQPKEPKLTFPIFVLNLSKGGTLTFANYFACGFQHLNLTKKVAHYWHLRRTRQSLGACMLQNIQSNQTLLQDCYHDVITDASVFDPEKNQCFHMGIHGLEAIAKDYPNATIVYVKRDAEQWFESAIRWGNLLGRMARACPDIPIDKKHKNDKTKWIDFYNGVADRIDEFAQNHPSLNYIRATLEQPDLAEYLQQSTGINTTCWGHYVHKTDKDADKKKQNSGLVQLIHH